ncbi:MAG: DUF1697 domain-containing protein [Acidobacteriota bacterium]
MVTYVALLRGINVGGSNLVPMKALKAVVAGLGHDDVATYIASGNVVFTCARADEARVAANLEAAIQKAFGLRIAVVLRTHAELAAVAGSNPFRGREARVYVTFLAGTPSADALARLDPARSAPDEYVVRGRDIYLHLPSGAGQTTLSVDYFQKQLGTSATTRNWNTVNRLVDLSRRSC